MQVFSQSLMPAITEIKMSEISPTFHKLTGFGDAIAVVEGPAAGDATFVETENGFVIGLPGGMTVKILHETLSRAQKGVVSENESNEDSGLDVDAKSEDEQGVEPELIGAEVKIERELINQSNSSSEEEKEAGAEQVETESGVVRLKNDSSLIDLTNSSDSDSEYSTDENLSAEEDYNESQE
jgi:hypothetical protein